jgi:hypothetical protein
VRRRAPTSGSPARRAERHLELTVGSGAIRSRRFRACGGRTRAEQMDCLVVEVQGLDGGAKAVRAGSRDGIALFAHAPGKGACERVAQQAPYLGSISRQQRSAKSVQIVEHLALMIGPKEHIATNVPCARASSVVHPPQKAVNFSR